MTLNSFELTLYVILVSLFATQLALMPSEATELECKIQVRGFGVERGWMER